MSQEETSTEQLPHVLVVDDSRLMRVAVKKILKQDYRLSEAVDGETGWKALTSDDSIQVVISDLSMPNLDGFGLLEKIRTSANERIKNIPVIIIAGADDDDVTKTRALDCGASDFITKPFDSIQLRARTKSHFEHDQTSRKLTEVSTALEENTSIDPLTGLANKRHFDEKGLECIAFSKRHGTTLSVIRLDIDLFEKFFVVFGRQPADSVIKTISSILLSSLRKEDTAARIGLSKFALILVNSNQMGVANLANRIQKEISEEVFGIPEAPVRLTVSMGITSTETVLDYDFNKLISVANEQLAIAISNGGNSIASAPEVIAETKPTIQALPEEAVLTQEAPAAESQTTDVPDLEKAVDMVSNSNQQDALVPHLKILLNKMLPLLEFCNERMGLDIDEMIEKLKKRL